MPKKLILFLTILFLNIYVGRTVLAQESNQSTDTIREKVKEKIENVLNNPKAYLGTITDKTEDTLQIKNMKGEIQFVSVDSENTNFVSITKTSKTIKYEDAAIGDFIIAMGFISEDKESPENGESMVLEAKRVLVTQILKPTLRKIVFGDVVGIEKKILTLKSGGQDYKFEFPKRWQGPEIDEIEESGRVAVVGISEEDKFIIRTIEIIQNTNVSPTPAEE